jgi:hypothetical protein
MIAKVRRRSAGAGGGVVMAESIWRDSGNLSTGHVENDLCAPQL